VGVEKTHHQRFWYNSSPNFDCHDFGEAVLQRREARQRLINYWIRERRRGEPLLREAALEDFQYRQECAEKVGLGFNLPTLKRALFALRGLQNEENVVAASRHLTPI
jgi:hypothetical protein